MLCVAIELEILRVLPGVNDELFFGHRVNLYWVLLFVLHVWLKDHKLLIQKLELALILKKLLVSAEGK